MRARKIIRRTLWTIIALVTLIALLYAEENWRGARALREAENAYAHAGISLDYKKQLPAPIPDSENLGALPLFELQPDTSKPPVLRPLRLEAALREDLPTDRPNLGSVVEGKRADLNSLRKLFAAQYALVYKSSVPPVDPQVQLETLYPFLGELRTASATRSRCRFNVDYGIDPPFERALEPMIKTLAVARILAVDGVLALHSHQPDIALADIRTILVLADGGKNDPTLVGGLVDMGTRTFALSVLVEGLALHSWNDAQLAQLQAKFSAIDSLAEFRIVMEDEASEDVLNYRYFKAHPSILSNVVGLITGETGAPLPRPSFSLLGLIPPGWFDANEAHLLQFHLSCVQTIDPAARRFYPDRLKTLNQAYESSRRSPRPTNILADVAESPLRDMGTKFARAQTLIDHAALACAIERYRLTHGNYPDALEALSPDYIAKLPQDVVTGQPLSYRLLSEGGYLLYSVGANDTDDGGTSAYYKDSIHSYNEDEGDWVWFGPK